MTNQWIKNPTAQQLILPNHYWIAIGNTGNKQVCYCRGEKGKNHFLFFQEGILNEESDSYDFQNRPLFVYTQPVLEPEEETPYDREVIEVTTYREPNNSQIWEVTLSCGHSHSSSTSMELGEMRHCDQCEAMYG